MKLRNFMMLIFSYPSVLLARIMMDEQYHSKNSGAVYWGHKVGKTTARSGVGFGLHAATSMCSLASSGETRRSSEGRLGWKRVRI